MIQLTELEGVAIGIIKAKICTAYKIRKELKASPSSQWRASAGAIYPLLKRPEDKQLLESIEDDDDGRGRKLLTATSKGGKTFTHWIKQIHQNDLMAKISDPLRTRIFFLDCLNKKEQIQFTEDALESLNKLLIIAQQHLDLIPESKDMFGYLGAKGGLIYTQGRIEFLSSVLAKLTDNKIHD